MKKNKKIKVIPEEKIHKINGDFSSVAPSVFEVLFEYVILCGSYWVENTVKVMFIEILNAKIYFSPIYKEVPGGYKFEGMTYQVEFGYLMEDLYLDTNIPINWNRNLEDLGQFTSRLLQQSLYTLFSFIPNIKMVTFQKKELNKEEAEKIKKENS